jgi:hypothetical protein
VSGHVVRQPSISSAIGVVRAVRVRIATVGSQALEDGSTSGGHVVGVGHRAILPG